MDFPNDIATNVYRIDDVKEIYWALYSRRHDEEEERAYDALSERGKRDVTHLLQIAELDLRKQGNHAVLSGDKSGIWVFCISEDEKESLRRVLNSDEFECKRFCSGYLRAMDLASGPGSGGTGLTAARPIFPANASIRHVKATGEVHAPMPGANLLAGTRALTNESDNLVKGLAKAGQDQPMNDLFRRMLSALSLSVAYELSKQDGFLQIGSRTCVDARTLSDDIFEHLELNLGAPGSTTTVSSHVRWLSSGTLLFTFFSATIPMLCTVSHIVSRDRHLLPGASILLSPSGAVGQYYGIENTPKGHPLYHSRLEVKASILARLSPAGTSMPPNSPWIFVIPDVDEYHEESREPVESRPISPMTLWPARLCLCKDTRALEGGSENRTSIAAAAEGPIDPLEKAQEWFLGKAARMEALEIKSRKAALEAQRLKETEDMDEEDAMSDFQPHIAQGITPRDVSAIYPTPPDGLPSVANDSSMSNDPQSSGNDDELNAAMTVTDKNYQPYEEAGHDDLFEEMDIDLFATNGLTEADFSFFDEPSLEGDVENGGVNPILSGDHLAIGDSIDIAPAALTPDHHSSPILQGGQDNEASPVLTPDRGELPQEQEQILGEDSKDVSLIADIGLPSLKDQLIPEVSSIKEEAFDCSPLDLYIQTPESPQRSQVSFDNVPFLGASLNFDHKYALQGRYGFSLNDLPKMSRLGEQPSPGDYALPQVGLFQMNRSSVEDDIDIDDTDEGPSVSSSILSKDYDAKDASGRPSEQAISKMNRDSPEFSEQPATPLSHTSQIEIMDEKEIVVSAESLFSPRESTRANLCFDAELETRPSSYTATFIGNGRRFIQVAQMVADQAIYGPSISRGPFNSSPERRSIDITGLNPQLRAIMTKLSARCCKTSKQCALKEFVDLDDQDPANTSRDQSPLQQRFQKPLCPTRASLLAGQSIIKLPSPQTCVQRTGTSIDIATSALRFWEELGLGPSHNSKDIMAFCVYPADRNAEQGVATFLNMMKGAYQSCNLGLHKIGSGLIEHSNGLAPVPMDDGRLEGSLSKFHKACEDFGTWLGRSQLHSGNTIIYMANPSSDKQYLPILCAAFLKLFDAYRAAVKEQGVERQNDLVLQVIPSEVIFSAQIIPMPSPADYRSLAFEVYDRCGPNENGEHRKKSQYICAPSIRLAKGVPKTIEFRLTPENSALYQQSDNCIHIAYAWSPGEDWLTASWIDNMGVLSWNACYFLGDQDESPWLSFYETGNEIWETTLDMLQPRDGPWRLFITKDSPAHKTESDAWHSIFTGTSKPTLRPPILSTFLTVETNPLLDFPVQEIEARGSDLLLGSLATPDNTPQANAPSPDMSGLGSTPGGATQVSTPPPGTAFGEHDAEARLVDITDETWGIVMNRSVDDLCSSSDHCLPVASGYLVKRAGPRDEDGLVRMEVNIIHGQKPYRPLLKAVLGMYRNLGLLARVRGIVSPVKSVVPFHVAAARKAHMAISGTMSYEEG